MSQSEPDSAVDTLEEDLGNPNLLQILLIIAILIVAIPIGFIFNWLKKLDEYFFKKIFKFKNNYFRNKLCK